MFSYCTVDSPVKVVSGYLIHHLYMYDVRWSCQVVYDLPLSCECIYVGKSCQEVYLLYMSYVYLLAGAARK
jgi:hypothetical protein